MSDKTAMKIRPATAMDSVNIVRLIKAGYEETPAKQVAAVDELKLLGFVNQALQEAFVLVADLEGRLLGTISFAPIRLPWCTAVVMTEMWFAVVPQYRAKRVPEQLLEATEKFLDQRALPGFLGSQMLTPPVMNAIIAKRSEYQASRQTFLRMPCSHVDEKSKPVMPPKKAVSA